MPHDGKLPGQADSAKCLAGPRSVGLFRAPSFYPSNITSDKETGIGASSTQDIVKLLRTGVRPDGREVAPMMPWRSYAQGSTADLEALAAFIKTVPAVKQAVPGPTRLEDVKTPYVTVVLPSK